MLDKFSALGYKTSFIRCNNGKEHIKDIEDLCNKNTIILELNASNTPEQNGVVERRIASLKQRGQAMMLAANFNKLAKRYYGARK